MIRFEQLRKVVHNSACDGIHTFSDRVLKMTLEVPTTLQGASSIVFLAIFFINDGTASNRVL